MDDIRNIRVFSKIVSSCYECPNICRDEEENLDSCLLNFEISAYRIIPENCPLPRQITNH